MIDSSQAKAALRKTVAAITGFILAMVLLVALLVTGFYLLVKAAVMALAPIMGAPGSYALMGVLCVLLLVFFFWRMTRPAAPAQSGSEGSSGGSVMSSLRRVIQQNPLEAALAAFTLGIAEQGDPRLRSLLLQGMMKEMRQAEGGAGEPESSPEPEAEPEPPAG
ncbi:hypothetical protein [Marinobacter oulmenensis]|uniref:Putative membrane protein n=1 Tax=Marinobacter oulmenensis TaxID=643747 RepID=A0A840U3B2_9GAMM|nr:hypothetical protein [Marinobacter oulmenensis]MBB5320194.1 putative membrane protein [Marinobacter oulmenensis]